MKVEKSDYEQLAVNKRAAEQTGIFLDCRCIEDIKTTF